MSSLVDLLAASSWVQALSPSEREALAGEVIERAFPAGAYICRKGEPVEHWIGVVDGLLKLSNVSRDGRSATLTGIPPLGWFGEGSMLKTETRRYDVVALRASRVALVPRATFSRLLDSSIPFNRFLLSQLNERLAYFISMLEHERLLEPDARVARCLAGLFNPVLYPGVGRRLAISQEELGLLSGVSRQRANQALQVLEKAGLLRIEYGGITVENLDGLRTFGTL